MTNRMVDRRMALGLGFAMLFAAALSLELLLPYGESVSFQTCELKVQLDDPTLNVKVAVTPTKSIAPHLVKHIDWQPLTSKIRVPTLMQRYPLSRRIVSQLHYQGLYVKVQTLNKREFISSFTLPRNNSRSIVLRCYTDGDCSVNYSSAD